MATIDVGDKHSVLIEGLSGFWQRFFRDVKDLKAFYQASEVYLGQAYLDMLSSILNVGLVDTPVFNKEAWKLLTIKETELNFKEGRVPVLDRFVYALPEDYIALTELQNTIFAPSVVLEKDLDFDTNTDDATLEFSFDLFRSDEYENGELGPIKGVASRNITQEAGNALFDTYQREFGSFFDYQNAGVRRGDTLRILATFDTVLLDGTAGVIQIVGDTVYFFGVDAGVSASVGDVIDIYDTDAGPAGELFITKLLVKEVDSGAPNQVIVDSTTVGCPTVSSSGTNLFWRLRKAAYYTNEYKEYEIDYIDRETHTLVGASGTPIPIEFFDVPVVYAVVRTPYANVVSNLEIAFEDTTISDPPPTFFLGHTDIDFSSVQVIAYKSTYSGLGSPINYMVEEGVDYIVDYITGVLTQLKPWHSLSPGDISFTFKKRVLYSAGGDVYSKDNCTIKQLSFWTAVVDVDRFTVWYNYGSLLNRFGSSTDLYKAFIRGIMHLYVSGPILERIESALNLAVGLSVISTDGEILQSYFDGVDSSGVQATISSSANTVQLPTSEYRFTEVDLGGHLIIDDSAHAVNTGTFVITGIDFITNTASVASEYNFVDAVNVTWTFSRNYMKVVTTDIRIYTYPYTTPMREDLDNTDNYGVLSFSVFETLTEAFRVTDYLEDPQWWHNKYIPAVLWETANPNRRFASNELYEHVIGAEDRPCIGDPGFYIGADSYGNMYTPTDGVGNPVPLYRHKTAFVVFDTFLKLHMFFVGIDGRLELDTQFQEDLEDLILIAKPSFTYPYVTPSERFIDNITVDELFRIAKIIFSLGGDSDGKSDSLHIGGNTLLIGDSKFPYRIGDLFRYGSSSDVTIPGAPPVVSPIGTIVDLGTALPVNSRFITVNINATVNGELVLEHRDYVVNWRVSDDVGGSNPSAWHLTVLTEWDGLGVSLFPTITFQYVTVIDNSSYDTRNGDTPIHIGGTNPYYIRHTALDPGAVNYELEWRSLRTEHPDRSLQLTINVGGLSYTY